MNPFHSTKFSRRFSAGLQTPRSESLSRKFQALEARTRPAASSSQLLADFWTPGLLDHLHAPLSRYRD